MRAAGCVPIRAMSFTISCPDCASPVSYLTNSHPRPHETRAVVFCHRCRREHIVVVLVLSRNGYRARPIGAK